MEFSKNQQLLIHAMIEQKSKSIRDFYGDAPGYDIFLQNRQITPTKKREINKILKDAIVYDPTIDDGFNKPELKKIKKRFHSNKRKLSYIHPRRSTHSITTRSITKKTTGNSKTKKRRRKKIKKKKRKSYKK